MHLGCFSPFFVTLRMMGLPVNAADVGWRDAGKTLALAAAVHGVGGAPLLRASAAAELPLVRARWAVQWGEGLAVPTLLAEEDALDAHPYAAAGGRAHLVLECPALGAAPDGAPFCGACEVHRLPCVLGGAPAGDAWLLACVFVPPPLRGRGVARALVRAVAAAAAAAGAPALWLFSDIGAPFYEALGFSVAGGGGAYDVLLPPAAGGEDASVEDFSADALPVGLPAAAAGGGGGSGSALLLERARVEWLLHQERLRAGAGGLRRGAAPCAGARRGRATALWRAARAPDGGAEDEEELLLLHFSGEGDDAAAVLRRAQAVAAGAGLARVRLWDARGAGLETLVEGAARVPREGKLPMVLALKGDPAMHVDTAIERGCWY